MALRQYRNMGVLLSGAVVSAGDLEPSAGPNAPGSQMYTLDTFYYRIDPGTGAFAGYAWGENIGWISLKGGSGPTAYGVVTDFRHIYLPLVLKPSERVPQSFLLTILSRKVK